MKRYVAGIGTMAAIMMLFLGVTAGAQEAPPLPVFAGKTVRMIVGNSAGGGNDLTSRLIAKYLSEEIPGKPTIITQNQPGAGGLIAANSVFTVGASDGSLIANVNPSNVLQQALG